MIGRRIPGAKAWSAECRFNNGSCFHQGCNCPVLHQFHIDRGACRIYAECELIRADVTPLDDIRRRTDILKSAARAACDDSLLYIQFAIHDLILKCIVYRFVQADQRLLLHVMKHILKVGVYLVDGVDVGRVEWHRDHWLDLA